MENVSATRPKRSFAVLFAIVYICLLFVAVFLNRLSWLLLVLYSAASLVTFTAYWWDKSAAKRGRRRTAESSLHLMGVLGGWPGALAAQRLLRHKSSKQQFLTVFWATVLINVAAGAYLAWVGQASVINRFIEGIWQIVVP